MRPPIAEILNGARNELAHMGWTDYWKYPAMHCSMLKEAQISMRHLKQAWEVPSEDTDAKRFGRLMHATLFEPATVEDRYRVWDTSNGSRRTNAYKAFAAEAQLDGCEVVLSSGPHSLGTAMAAAEHFLAHPHVRSLIASGRAEQTVLATDEGIQCIGQIDWISGSQHVLVDLKTTAQITPQLFGNSFFNFNYHLQLGMYRRWLNRVTGSHWPVQVIVLESHPPYDVWVSQPLPDAALDEGVDRGLRLLKKIRQAIAADAWPGVDEGELVPLPIPYWAMQEETEEFQG